MTKSLSKQTIHILQWNCQSLQRKRASLTQYLNTLDRKPDVILLQDTQGTHSLPQYTPYTQPSVTQTDRKQHTYTLTLVTTYISKKHPSIQLNITDVNTAHQEHVITLQSRNCPNPITIVNAYRRPGRNVANPTPHAHQTRGKQHRPRHSLILKL